MSQHVPQVSREAVCHWLSQQHDQRSRFCCARLGELLSRANAAWTPSAEGLTSDLADTFGCVAVLSRQVVDSAPPAAEGVLADWQKWGAAIADRWPPDSSDNWIELLVDSSFLANGTVTATLTESLASHFMQLATTSGIDGDLKEMAKRNSKWCADLPVPPAPLRSRKATDYVHRTIHPKPWKLCREVIENLSGWQLADHIDGDSSQEFAARKFNRAMRSFDSLMQLLQHGWPVEAERLVSILGHLESSLAALQPHADPQFIELVRAASHGLSVQSRQESNAAEKPAMPASTAQVVTEKCAESNGDIRGSLLEIAARLEQDPAPGVEVLSKSLRKLAQRQRHADNPTNVELPAGEMEWGPVLSVLIRLDRMPQRPRQIDAARQQLRQLLLGDKTGIEILSEDLCGRPLRDCMELANVVGKVHSSTVRADCIAEIVRPGYLLAQGKQRTILRPADVTVAQ